MDRSRLTLFTYTALVMGICALPGGTFDGPDMPGMDKIVHGVMFLPLGMFARRAYRRRIPQSLSPRGQALLYCLCAALISEAIQLFVPLRTASFFDLSADMLGGVTGAFLAEISWNGRQNEDRSLPV